MSDWRIFLGSGQPHDGLSALPPPPPWRTSSVQAPPVKPLAAALDLEAERDRGAPIQVNDEVRRAVNAALLLRRPLLLTGKPGVGKSSLISAVAYELRMGPALRWPITSRSTVRNGLYEYDAVGRLQARDNEGEDIGLGDFLRLGPLGTALYPTSWPRALLIDEIDKGDIDLPNDLLNVLEEGRFEIPELARAKEPVVEVRVHDPGIKRPVTGGIVRCEQFPFIVMTSNGEREFPAPFLRRCIRITVPEPTEAELATIIKMHLEKYLDGADQDKISKLIGDFVNSRRSEQLATDQLLNAVFMVFGDGRQRLDGDRDEIVRLLLKQLSTPQAT